MLVIKVATEDGIITTLYLENDWKFSKIKNQLENQLNIPVDKQKLYKDGNLISDEYDKISDSGLKNGDVLLVKSDLVPYDYSTYSSQEPPMISDDEIFNTVDELFNYYKPGSLEMKTIKLHDKPLHDVVKTGDRNELFKFLKNRYKKMNEERIEYKKKLLKAYMDPLNPESQILISKEIEKNRIDQNLINAQNYLPESFGNIELLYIKLEINGVPVNALVDTGAQNTIMSKSVAKRCHLLSLVDDRFKSVAVGVGSVRTLGKIHILDVKIGTIFVPLSLIVIDGNNFEFILGLDVLRRYTCDINLKNHYLGINDIKVPFLSDAEVVKIKSRFSPRRIISSRSRNSRSSSSSSSSSNGNKGSASDFKLEDKTSTEPSSKAPLTQPIGQTPSKDVIEEKVKRLCETFNLQPDHARHLLEIAGWDEELAASFVTE